MIEILQYVLLFLMVLCFAWFLVSFMRAGTLASRHKDDMTNAQKVSWWFRFFRADVYGSEDESKRKRIASHIICSFGLVFVIIGLLMLTGTQPAE